MMQNLADVAQQPKANHNPFTGQSQALMFSVWDWMNQRVIQLFREGQIMRQTIELLVKLVIGRAKGRPPAKVLKDHTLEDTYAFSVQGRQNLAFSISGKFAENETPIVPPLAPQETEACVTVRDVMNLVKMRFGV